MRAWPLYTVVAVQFLVAAAMWFVAVTNPVGLQSEWAVLLGIELLLASLIVFSAIRYFAGGNYGK